MARIVLWGPPGFPVEPRLMWAVTSPDGVVRVEIWTHPAGWECRVYDDDRVEHAAAFGDVRDAHREALAAIERLRVVNGIPTARPRNPSPFPRADGSGPSSD